MQSLILAGAIGLSIIPMILAEQNVWTTTATWDGQPTTITVGDYSYTSPQMLDTTVTPTNYLSPKVPDSDGKANPFPPETITMTLSDAIDHSAKAVETVQSIPSEPGMTLTFTSNPQTITEDDGEIVTVPCKTSTMTISDGFLNDPPPVKVTKTTATPSDHTSISMWTETTTYTEWVPATTMTDNRGEIVTLSEWHETITWTRIVTTHITVPDGAAYPTTAVLAGKTTLDTVITTAAHKSSTHDV